MLKRYIGTAATVLLIGAALALVVGQLLGQPILLGFVTSDSMSPALETGDGFVAVPQPIAGGPEEGDVIVFDAIELEDGGLTTHRVVDKTEDGYITKGDNNPFLDQDGDEPPVSDDRVVATALQLNGWVVSIPQLGTAVMSARSAVLGAQTAIASALGTDAIVGTQGTGILLISVGLLLFLVSLADDLRQSTTRDRTRSIQNDDSINGRRVALVVVFLVLVPANVAMVAPSGTHQVVADGDEIAGDVSPGESIESEFTANNDGLVAMLVVFESTHQSATMERNEIPLPRGESTTTELSIPAPSPGEKSVVTVTEHRYVLLLPANVIGWLHSIHPIVALGTLNALIGLGVFGFVGGLLGFRRVRVRETSRQTPLRLRLRRLFK